MITGSRAFLFSLAIGGTCLSASGVPVAAQDARPSTVLGAGILTRPAYLGSNETVMKVVPLIRYYGRSLFARTTQGVLEGGARRELLHGFSVGVQVAYEGGREGDDANFLASNNVATMPVSLSYGVHAEWDTKILVVPLIALLRFRQDAHARESPTQASAWYGPSTFPSGGCCKEDSSSEGWRQSCA